MALQILMDVALLGGKRSTAVQLEEDSCFFGLDVQWGLFPCSR